MRVLLPQEQAFTAVVVITSAAQFGLGVEATRSWIDRRVNRGAIRCAVRILRGDFILRGNPRCGHREPVQHLEIEAIIERVLPNVLELVRTDGETETLGGNLSGVYWAGRPPGRKGGPPHFI